MYQSNAHRCHHLLVDIDALHIDQTCSSLEMVKIYGRNVWKLCIINIKTSCKWLVLKVLYINITVACKSLYFRVSPVQVIIQITALL